MTGVAASAIAIVLGIAIFIILNVPLPYFKRHFSLFKHLII